MSADYMSAAYMKTQHQPLNPGLWQKIANSVSEKAILQLPLTWQEVYTISILKRTSLRIFTRRPDKEPWLNSQIPVKQSHLKAFQATLGRIIHETRLQGDLNAEN
jgi:hypothetical protein